MIVSFYLGLFMAKFKWLTCPRTDLQIWGWMVGSWPGAWFWVKTEVILRWRSSTSCECVNCCSLRVWVDWASRILWRCCWWDAWFSGHRTATWAAYTRPRCCRRRSWWHTSHRQLLSMLQRFAGFPHFCDALCLLSRVFEQHSSELHRDLMLPVQLPNSYSSEVGMSMNWRITSLHEATTTQTNNASNAEFRNLTACVSGQIKTKHLHTRADAAHGMLVYLST